MINESDLDNKKIRKVLDIKTKKEIYLLSQQGLSHQAIANKFAVGRSTVTKIILNKDILIADAKHDFHNCRKRIRKSHLDNIEIELLKWCVDDSIPTDEYGTCLKEDLNSESIINKAEELAKEMDIKEVSFTITWLNRFKKKYNLVYKSIKNFKINLIKSYEQQCSSNSQIPIVRSNVPDYLMPNKVTINYSMENNQTNNQFSYFNTIINNQTGRYLSLPNNSSDMFDNRTNVGFNGFNSSFYY